MSADRPLPGAPRPYAFPHVSREVMANGLVVHVAPLRRLPVVTALLMSDAGAECDTVSSAGVAALTADAIAEGTEAHDAASLADAFEQLGGSLDTGVGWTYAEYSTTMLASSLPGALQLLAEVVMVPTFPDEEVSRLREERLAELLQQRAEPRGLADDMFARFSFAGDSRYANSEGGDDRTVPTLTREGVIEHHKRYAVPSRSALIITGDVEVDDVMRLADGALGSWAGNVTSAPQIVVAPAHHTREVHLVAKSDSPQSELRVGHLSIPRTHPDFHALSVMNAILGGLFNSRINLNLRESHAYTYGAFTHFDWRRRASTFEVSTAVRSDVTAAAVREIFIEIDRMRSELVSPSELSLAVDYLTGVFPIRFETTAAIADALAMREGYGLDPDYYDRYRERVASINSADVLRVAQEHLDPSRMQVVAVGDPAVIRGEMEGLALGPLHVYDSAGTLIS